MKLKFMSLLVLSIIANFAVAAPVWLAQTLEFKEGRSDEFVEGLNTFMGSKLGKKAPGQVALNWVSVNGANAATHGMVMNFPSMAAYQEWNQLFWLDSKYEAERLKWVSVFRSTVEHSNERMMTSIKTWGNSSADYRYIEWVPFNSDRLDLISAAMDKFLSSADGKKFKGRVNLAQCLFCGEGESNGAIAVMYRDMAEMDDWRAIYSASEDFSEWAASVNAVASFPGNSLIVNLQRFD
ncbi:MAG: hypothetical protein P8P54_14705 [Pseudomonadales bacterium]|nr:hypothetical protein [Pseudomonadales bacterium]MDG1305414.1 hypothetical protein [Pseudomonadales bacterium]